MSLHIQDIFTIKSLRLRISCMNPAEGERRSSTKFRRRTFLSALVATNLALLTATQTSAEEPALPRPPATSYDRSGFEKIVNDLPIPTWDPNEQRTLDPDYLKRLLENLKTESLTKEERLSAIESNVALCVGRLDQNNWLIMSGLMIDRSGIFLTTAHSLTNYRFLESGAFAYSRSLNQSFPAASYMFDRFTDLGIVYAPTELPAERVPGIQFSPKFPEAGSNLRQFAIWQSTVMLDDRASDKFYRNELKLARLDGKVLPDTHPIYPSLPGAYFRAVYGMIPFAGASGAPVANMQDGTIVAVESGHFGNEEDYNLARRGLNPGSVPADFIPSSGSVVAPITHIRSLSQRRIFRI